MGCCLSSGRGQAPSSPYSSPTAQGDSSSRAITRNPSVLPHASDVDTSTIPQEPVRPSRRRNLGLNEHYNKPLKRHVWTADKNWTREELDRERDEYFDTRVTGRAETWSAIRMAIETMETDLRTAQTIIDAAGVTIPTGDLINGAYDEVGNYYAIPEPCVSDPVNMAPSHSSTASPQPLPLKDEVADPRSDPDTSDLERRREEKGKAVLHPSELHFVKARLSDRGGPDIQVTISQDQSVRVLVRKVQEEAGLTGRNKVRIAYMGKMLKESESLHAQGWQEGHVVNALVFS